MGEKLALFILVIFLFCKVFGRRWNDNPKFICDNYVSICNNFLDQLECKNRTVRGCLDDKVEEFIGTCSCSEPFFLEASGDIISNQLIENRVKHDVYWLLSPWKGPPYNVSDSYENVCELLMKRINCPEKFQVIQPSNYTCSCGNFVTSNDSVLDLIIDSINERKLSELIVFDAPQKLNVQFSIALLLVIGKLGSIAASAIRLPAVVGFLLVGMAIQDILSPVILKGCAGAYGSSPASEIKAIALLLILMRAGISLRPKDIIKNGFNTISLATIPYIFETISIIAFGMKIFDYPFYDMALFGAILGTLGPSLIIPEMLKLISEGLATIPKQILIIGPIEIVFAVLLFNELAIINTQVDPHHPWLPVFPLWLNIVLIPVNILFSCVIGGICGYGMSRWVLFRSKTKNQYIIKMINGSTAEYLFIYLVGSYLLFVLCVPEYIPESSAVLVVISCSIVFSHFSPKNIIEDLKHALSGIWVFAEVFLFTLTGTSISFSDKNGPLSSDRGLSSSEILKIIAVLSVGTIARCFGIFIIVSITAFLSKKKFSFKYYAYYWIATYVFVIPKATILATLGGVPYSKHLIPGSDGIKHARFIQKATAFTILIMATTGLILTKFVGKRLLKRLTVIEKASIPEHHSNTPEITKPSSATTPTPTVPNSSTVPNSGNLTAAKTSKSTPTLPSKLTPNPTNGTISSNQTL